MKTIKDLRNRLISVFDKVENGATDTKTAKELNSCANNITRTVKTQLEYARLREEKPQIGFLRCK